MPAPAIATARRSRRGCGRARRAAAAADARSGAGQRRTRRAARRRRRGRRGQRVAPAVGLGVREAVDDGEQAGRGGDDAGDVEARPVAVRGAWCEQRDRADRGRDGESDVDVEGTSARRGTRSARRRAAGRRRRRRPRSRRRCRTPWRARRRVGEGGGQQRERRPGEQRTERRPGARGRATSSSKLCAAPPSAEAAAKPIRPDDERPLAAEEVGEPAAEQQQAAEGQRVGGDDPLPVAVGEAEGVLRGGQRDVHDGGVEHDHQLGDAEDGEDRPAPGRGRSRGRAGAVIVVPFGGLLDQVEEVPPSGGEPQLMIRA